MGKSLRTHEKNNLHNLHTLFEKEERESVGKLDQCGGMAERQRFFGQIVEKASRLCRVCTLMAEKRV